MSGALTGKAATLAAQGLHLGYHGHDVVADASLALVRGEVVALVGPNGSGKSTLLRALARLHRPDAGDLLLEGTSAAGLSPRAFARRVTMLAQQRPVPTGVAVRDLVGYGRHPHRRRWGGRDPEGAAAIARALTLTGLDAMADRSVDELSGGELQRVWVATCLAQDTSVLLLDEPTTFLDLRYQVEILDLIRDLASDHDVAVGVVLHDLNQAAAVADRVVLLCQGRVRAAGAPADVLTSAHLTEVYGIPVAVAVDPLTNELTTRPVGRHSPTRTKDLITS